MFLTGKEVSAIVHRQPDITVPQNLLSGFWVYAGSRQQSPARVPQRVKICISPSIIDVINASGLKVSCNHFGAFLRTLNMGF
jgi:hypothetical protein